MFSYFPEESQPTCMTADSGLHFFPHPANAKCGAVNWLIHTVSSVCAAMYRHFCCSAYPACIEWQKSAEWDGWWGGCGGRGVWLWACQDMMHCVHSGKWVVFIWKSMPKLRQAPGDLKLWARVVMLLPCPPPPLCPSPGKTSGLFLSPVLSKQISKTPDLQYLLKSTDLVTFKDLYIRLGNLTNTLVVGESESIWRWWG